MSDACIQIYGQLSGTPSEVDHRHTQVAFFLTEHRFTRGQWLQNNVDHIESSAIDTLDDVLCGGVSARDHVHVHFQTIAGQPQRLSDTFLSIHHEFPWQDMKDASFMLDDRERPSAFKDPRKISL